MLTLQILQVSGVLMNIEILYVTMVHSSMKVELNEKVAGGDDIYSPSYQFFLSGFQFDCNRSNSWTLEQRTKKKIFN